MNALSFDFPLNHVDCQSKPPTAHADNASPADIPSSAGVSSSSSQLQSLSPSIDGEISVSGNKSNAHPNSVAALKEWAIVCKAAGDGKQVLLFRKGGIMEYRNGFELKHKHFFLFPTFEHQSMDSIRDEYKEKLVDLDKQQQHQQPIAKNKYNRSNASIKDNSDQNRNFTDIDLFVEITYFSEINDVGKLEKLEKFHIWNDDYVKMRYNYNPKKPLYVLLLRTYKLNDVLKVYNKPEWSGCKSWIQLDLKGEGLVNCFKNIPSPDFEYLKSISKPCIDDVTFNNITKELRSVI
jgi:hypothetical protein